MANLDFVTDRLATGGDLPYGPESAIAEALAEWRGLGITHVVDNRVEWSDEDLVASLAPELAYLHNGVDDIGGGQPDEWYERGTAWVLDALADPDARVLVHCHMGINRGPSLTYATLLELGWDPVEAIDAIRTARPIAAVGYAEDALDWHHRRHGVDADVRAEHRRRLAEWRREHHIDVVRIIRQVRAAERNGRVA